MQTSTTRYRSDILFLEVGPNGIAPTLEVILLVNDPDLGSVTHASQGVMYTKKTLDNKRVIDIKKEKGKIVP